MAQIIKLYLGYFKLSIYFLLFVAYQMTHHPRIRTSPHLVRCLAPPSRTLLLHRGPHPSQGLTFKSLRIPHPDSEILEVYCRSCTMCSNRHTNAGFSECQNSHKNILFKCRTAECLDASLKALEVILLPHAQ